jgi:hypothetical protein
VVAQNFPDVVVGCDLAVEDPDGATADHARENCAAEHEAAGLDDHGIDRAFAHEKFPCMACPAHDTRTSALRTNRSKLLTLAVCKVYPLPAARL